MLEEVLLEIGAERGSQDEKWGEQHHPFGVGGDYLESAAKEARAWCEARAHNGKLAWRDILFEEVSEAFAAGTFQELRLELIQVAAVAVAWIEDIDWRLERQEGTDGAGTVDARGAESGEGPDST